MFFLQEKLQERINELKRYRYLDMQSLFPMRGCLGENGPMEVYARVPERIDDFDVDRGFEVDGRDRYFWSHKRVKLPEAREDADVVGLFVMGQYGHLIGAETMCFVDRGLYQGVDQHHEEVVLSPFAGQEIDLDLLTWTGMEGKEPPIPVHNRVERAEIGYLWKPADDLFYALKAAQQTLEVLSEYDVQRVQLAEVVEGTLQQINWDRDKVRDTIPLALAYFNEHIEGMQKLGSGVHVDLTGATHIDLAWVWRLKHTREKAQRSFSTVIRLMEEFPEYVFSQSTPQLYKYVKQDNPELYEKIKARVAEGRWDADGGMWLEADCNISSGESLVRQFLHGMHFFREEFGKDCAYLWLPDVFGYSWSLPQILKGCGIKTFATTKIGWNQFNTMPHDLFSWRGIDGTDVLTFLLTSVGDRDDGQDNTPPAMLPPGATRSLQADIDNRHSSYNTSLTARVELASWLKFREKEYTRSVLIPYGHGDGGGGTTRGMIKTRRMLDKMPGLPEARSRTIGQFFENLHADVERSGKPLPVWDGELYLEYHRGTYTTQAENKKYNRRLENRLAMTEWLAAAAQRLGGDYPKAALEEGWEVVLRNQFHDIIPGSSIHEVYEESCAEYARVDETLDGLQAEALKTLLKPAENTWTVVNFSSFPRTEAVWIPAAGAGSFHTADGTALDAQPGEGGSWVLVPCEALSFTTVRFTPGAAETKRPFSEFRGSAVENDLYLVEWDDCGRFTRVYDKLAEREVLAEGQKGNVLEVFEDKPMRYDAWDIDIYYTQKREEFRLAEPVRVIENGWLRTVLRFVFRYNESTVTQDVVFHRDSRRIAFVTEADWHEAHRLLKAAFGVDIRATNASYDIQYGYVQRPTHFNTSWDYARFEVCGHKWADLSESNYGVSLLTDCKYGYNVHENVMKVSLLKSPKAPDRWADMGRHRFTYSLYPHNAGLTQGGTIPAGTALNLPLLVSSGAAALGRFIRVEGKGVNLDCCKLSWDGKSVVVRVHECCGGRAAFRIASDIPFKGWQACNLIEDDEGEAHEGSEIEGTLRAFQIRTFKLFF